MFKMDKNKRQKRDVVKLIDFNKVLILKIVEYY